MSIGGAAPIRRLHNGARSSRVENAAASARNRARSTRDAQDNPDEGNRAWVNAWSAALDELELDIEQAELLLQAGTDVETEADPSAAAPSRPAASVPTPRPTASRSVPARPRNAWASAATSANRVAATYSPKPAGTFSSGIEQPATDSSEVTANPVDNGYAQRPQDARDNQQLAEQVSLASEYAVDSTGVDQQSWAHSWAEPDAETVADDQADAAVWSPPDLPGQLPDELGERAAALLNRQLAVAQSLARAMLGNRQQSGLLERMDHTANETRSAYFDHSA